MDGWMVGWWKIGDLDFSGDVLFCITFMGIFGLEVAYS